LKDKEEGRRKYAQTLVNQEAQDFDAFFENLRKKYKSAEALAAIDLAETKAHQTAHYYLTIVAEILG
jgi:hypothetical protein